MMSFWNLGGGSVFASLPLSSELWLLSASMLFAPPQHFSFSWSERADSDMRASVNAALVFSPKHFKTDRSESMLQRASPEL